MPPQAQANERRYRLRGAAARLFQTTDPEVLLSGPAGTGKSMGCLLYLYHAADTVPNLRCLILRKTRASLTESALVTLERDVIPEGSYLLRGASRAMRRIYTFENGSEMVCAGLDKASKVMSTDWDLVYIQEAIELVEPEWEALTTRIGRRDAPYQRLIADTNPDRPTHWLKKRCEAGKTTMLESRHEDNPGLYMNGDWTPTGRKYLERLDKLTGPRKMRLRHGRWVQAEGVVYDGWDAALHLIQRFPIPADWPRFWSVDFGYTNPFAWQCWAVDPDGRAYLYREIYRTQRLVEDHAEEILRITAVHDGGEPRPKAIICDHDAEDRATLERHLRLKTMPAFKDVRSGIQAVASRLRKAGDGKPRLFVLRDSLANTDQALDDAKKPTCFAGEIDGYIWDMASKRAQGEEPVKENDHAMDAGRYLVAHLDLAQKRKAQVW